MSEPVLGASINLLKIHSAEQKMLNRMSEVIFYFSYFQILFTILHIVHVKTEASGPICRKAKNYPFLD